MEIQRLSLEHVLEWLRQRAAEGKNPLVVEARIAVTPEGARLVAITPERRPLATIRF